MKKIITIILVAMFSLTAFAVDAERDSLWNKAVAAYSEGDYKMALDNFSELENRGYSSPELFYNIGNCYFKQEHHLGSSILYYERALKLNPSFDDAKNNLALAREFTLDRIDEVPEFVLVTWVKNFRDTLSTNAWAYISLALFASMTIMLLLFRFSRRVVLRKTAFSVAIIAFIFAVITFLFSVSLNKKMTGEDQAVVMLPVSSVKSSPSSTQASLFIIHEGTKVNIIEKLGEWTRIELSDGRQGWLKNGDIEII